MEVSKLVTPLATVASKRCIRLIPVFLLIGLQAPNAAAQTFSNAQLIQPTISNITQPIIIAQQQPTGITPNILPTDVTPVGIRQARERLLPGYVFRLNQRLPERLWFNSTTEVSQRLDTNVFFTTNNPRPDYVFRALPNTTLGYNVLPNTSIYSNYFVIKDIFANHGVLSNPTTQSLSLGVRHVHQLSDKTSLQFDFQSRELWQVAGIRQADLLPSLNVTYQAGPKTVLFGSVVLQMRGKYYFTGPTREIDPFYTVGLVHTRGNWTFTCTDTLVNNFRNDAAIPPQGNVSMIADLEAARPISRRYPGVQLFVRAEPIWNWKSNNVPGISGFDFRLYTGLRLVLSKPAYTSDIKKVEKEILDGDQSSQNKPASGPAPVQPNTSIPGTVTAPLPPGVQK